MKRTQIKDPIAPDFLRYRGHTFNKTFNIIRKSISQSRIATVCEEANCPNKTECWSSGTATFMLMGNTCTRGCGFCSVKTSAHPAALNPDEPKLLTEAIYQWGEELNYIVLTSVDRDDLNDGGSTHFAKCIKTLKKEHPNIKIEVLIPDFKGDKKAIKRIIDAQPDVIAHNIETVERLTPRVRDRRATYQQSLNVLKYIKEISKNIFTKSSIMLGFTEKREEIVKTMEDLRNINVDFLTIGQYMRPSLKKLPVKQYLDLKVFNEYERIGKSIGFLYVASGPLVRSSYKAGEYFITNFIDSAK